MATLPKEDEENSIHLNSHQNQNSPPSPLSPSHKTKPSLLDFQTDVRDIGDEKPLETEQEQATHPPTKIHQVFQLFFFFLNGLKARSSKVFEIPVYLVSPKGYKHFYDQFSGPLQTTFEFKEFVTSTKSKYEVLSFKKLD